MSSSNSTCVVCGSILLETSCLSCGGTGKKFAGILNQPCGDCHGTGIIQKCLRGHKQTASTQTSQRTSRQEVCPTCDGTGDVWQTVENPNLFERQMQGKNFVQKKVTCPNCNGTRWILR